MVVAVVLLGGSGDDQPSTRAPAPTPTASPPPGPVDAEDSLALGITEPNPVFLGGDAAPPAPPEFARWSGVVPALSPQYYRLVIDWPSLTAPDGSGIDLAKPVPGCMRDKGPCAGWQGVRAQLQALAAAQQRSSGGLQGMVVFTGTPEAIAAPSSGCERSDTQPRSRPPRADQLGRYQDIVRAVLDEARRDHASIGYWSPWNEPNHPYFLSPQRARCDATAPTVSPGPYARLAEAMLEVLDDAPGDHRLVLGETAGLFEPKSSTTTVPEFVRALPRDLVCRAAVYGEHGYLGNTDPVGPVHRALASFDCPGGVPPIWITETGVKSSSASACRAVHRRLVAWYRDPRVAAVFQYTIREDDRFPTGLVSTDLSRAFPVLREWKAWGARPSPTAPPPAAAC